MDERNYAQMETCVHKPNESQNPSKTDTELHAESIGRAIINLALIRAQGLQYTLDHLNEYSSNPDVKNKAYHADAMLCHASETLSQLHFALLMQIKFESEQGGAA